MRFLFTLLLVVVAHFSTFHAAKAQDAAEKSSLIRYVEEQLSSPNRQISLNGLQGSLSSEVFLDNITIADEDGIWLTIVKPKLVWTRSALLSGRLEIDSLEAERIDYPRNAKTDESLPAPEAGSFALPELPVSINLKKLSVPKINFGRPVFGLETVTSVDGSVYFAEGNLDLDLAIKRLDGPTGTFDVRAGYAAADKLLDLDVKLTEPANGILANLLNIPDKPPVALAIKGKAPIDDLNVAMAFDVEGQSILSGNLRLDVVGDDTRARFNLGGPLSTILPATSRKFFGEESRLSAEALFNSSGTIEIKSFNLNSGSVALAANAKRLADGFFSAVSLDLVLANADESPVVLPSGEKPIELGAANISLNYDAQNNERWSGNLTAVDLKQDGLTIDTAAFVVDGTVTGYRDPLNRRVDFNLRGGIDQFSSNDPGLNAAIGPAIKIVGGGNWQSEQPLQLTQLSVSGDTFISRVNGAFADNSFAGSLDFTLPRLSAFSQLAEKKLSGRADLRANGKIDLVGGGFDLRVNGTTQNLSLAEENIDPLLTGLVTLAGGIARDENGFKFKETRLGNKKFDVNLNGSYSSKATNIGLNGNLRDVGLVAPQASGPVSFDAKLSGDDRPYDLSIIVTMKSGEISSKSVSDIALMFEGQTDGKFIRGNLSSNGSLDGKPVILSGVINANSKTISLQKVLAEIGQSRLSGDLRRKETGLIEANLEVDADDISDLAALALSKASGSVNGTVRLQPLDGKQSATVKLSTRSLRYQDYRVGSANIDGTATDLLGTPSINALIKASGVNAAGVAIRSLEGDITTSGPITKFDIAAALDQNNARIASVGTLEQNERQMVVNLSRLSLQSNITNARLISPTTVVVEDGNALLSNAALAIGNGRVQLTGTAGKRLNLTATIQTFPLAIINAIQPGTGAAGTVSGRTSITGTPADPTVQFDVNGSSVSVSQLASAGVTPLNFSARGRISNNVVALENASARNAQNINISANGRLPLSGPGLSLAVNGTAPLSMAKAMLASRGASASGTARFDVNFQGSLASPSTTGLLAIDSGTFTDPLSNLKLVNIGLLAGLDGERISINRTTANLSSGGSISANGSVGLKGALPANIAINLAGARYTDGQTFNTSANGQLKLSGNLLADPSLSGQINLGTTEITVPESFAKGSKLLDVHHVSPSQKTRATLNRIKKATPRARPTSRPSIIRLDIAIDAPNRIFVRGRGLDAELGGRIRITGPVTNISPTGRFTLRRGRLAILGQRIDLNEGSITLAGDLDPLLDLTATTDAGDVEASINLRGPVSDLKVTFSSTPELPQDEVLAKIIFGRGLGDLSPSQIVRLASIASELTGGSSPGLVDGIRKGTGLDDLDIVQDDEGNAAVKAGKYINDNVYLGVQAGQNKSEATINLDITDSLTARGAVSSDGDTSIGIFLEKDY